MSPEIKLTSYVALLRGINVGGHAVVSMKELKACLEHLGFQQVSTYINSGNIIFKDSGKDIRTITQLIESGIKAHCKMDIRVVIKSQKDLAAICKQMPHGWVTDKIMRTDVMFLWAEVDTPEMIAAIPVNPKVDRLLHVKGALIWNVTRKDYGKSKVPKMIGSKLYKNMTARNANTTRKLLELMSSDR
jgi:uncharacterized protein (DUF1697 family)